MIYYSLIVKKYYFSRFILIVTHLLGALFFSSCKNIKPTFVEEKKPNIVLIYADDLGKGLLGHEGQKIIRTPNIDKLATDGIRFTNAYSAMLCAPARATLITGLHDSHKDQFDIPIAGLYQNISTGTSTYKEIDNAINNVLKPVPEEQQFIGNIAKQAGYKTAQFGKLEWGFSVTDEQMKRHGWDYYLGYLDHQRAHGFYPPFLFENGKIKYYPGNTLVNSGKSIEPETPRAYKERWNRTGKTKYSQDIFMQGIRTFIASNKDTPFFLYFPTQLPHGPVAIPEVHSDFVLNDSLTQIEKEYASMVKLLDDNVGDIVGMLKEFELEENTIVIFTGDNGHEIYYAKKGRITKPYTNIKTGSRINDLTEKYYSDIVGDVFNGNAGRAGVKRSNLQGGIEVPLLIKWPKKIKPNSVSNRLVASYDMLPTLVDITGSNAKFKSDGISYYQTLLGAEATKEHDFIVYSSYIGPTLITNEGWKLRTYISEDIFELYHLPNDYKEEFNLADKYPEKVAELKKQLLAACDGDYKNGHFTSQKFKSIPLNN